MIYSKKTILLILSIFAYSPILILFPILKFNLNYAISMIFLFWLPIFIMLGLHLKYMYKNNMILAFLSCNLLMGITAFFFEYSSLGLDIWGFNEKIHPLLRSIFWNGFPWTIYGAPIEEFMFWFGATPLCILLYITFKRILETKREELLLTAIWPILLLPFFPIMFWMKNKLKDKNIISWYSILFTGIFFVVTLAIVEYNAVQKLHWVYNNKRILGLLVGTDGLMDTKNIKDDKTLILPFISKYGILVSKKDNLGETYLAPLVGSGDRLKPKLNHEDHTVLVPQQLRNGVLTPNPDKQEILISSQMRVPLEEILYYTLGPVFVVLLFLFYQLRPEIILRGTKSTNEFKDIYEGLPHPIKSAISKISTHKQPEVESDDKKFE